MTIIAVANQKGGVGKSTTAANLAVSLAQYGYEVLTVDWDSQVGLTDCLGIPDDDGTPSILDCIGDAAVPIADAVQPTAYPHLDHVASHIDLAHAEFRMIMNWETRPRLSLLGDVLAPVLPRYDVVIVDCPPSFGALTLMALTCADSLLIPVQCNYHSLRGVDRSISIVEELIKRPDLTPVILRTMVRTNTRVNRLASAKMVELFGDVVLATSIKLTTGFDESVLAQQPFVVFDPTSDAAEAYRTVARDLVRRLVITGRNHVAGAHAVHAAPSKTVNPVRGDTVWVVPAPLSPVDAPAVERLSEAAFAAGGHYSAWTTPTGYIFADEAKADDFVNRARSLGSDTLAAGTAD
jgi:chromosome partitioning protein